MAGVFAQLPSVPDHPAIEEEVLAVRDMDLWDAAVEQEERHKALLENAAKSLALENG